MATDIATGGPFYDRARPSALEAVVRAYVRYVPALFFFIMLFSCDVDFYLADFRLYGLGLALNFCWFILSLIIAPIPFRTLFSTAFLPFAGLIAAMLLWSVVFQVNTGGNFIFSFMALRHWLLFLVAPNIYMAYRIGVSFQRMSKALLFALLCAWVIFVCIYMFVPLEKYSYSPDPAIARLVAKDWRGFRLMVFPYAPFVFSICYLLGLTVRRPFRLTLFEILFAGCIATLFLISLSRFISLAVFLGTFSYILGRYFLSYLQRYSVLLLLSLLIMLAMGVLFVLATALSFVSSTTDVSYLVRLSSFITVIQGIIAHPILGLGQASNYSISQQQLFGATFGAEDTGIFGLVFVYGAVGLVIYGALTICGLRCSIRAYMKSSTGEARYLMGTLLHYSIVLLFLMTFNPMSIDHYGVPMMGCVFGFSMVILWPKGAADGYTQARQSGGGDVLSP